MTSFEAAGKCVRKHQSLKIPHQKHLGFFCLECDDVSKSNVSSDSNQPSVVSEQQVDDETIHCVKLITVMEPPRDAYHCLYDYIGVLNKFDYANAIAEFLNVWTTTQTLKIEPDLLVAIDMMTNELQDDDVGRDYLFLLRSSLLDRFVCSIVKR